MRRGERKLRALITANCFLGLRARLRVSHNLQMKYANQCVAFLDEFIIRERADTRKQYEEKAVQGSIMRQTDE